MATAGLKKMHDPKLALVHWLKSQGGTQVVGPDAVSHADTRGAHTTNDRVESNFGCYDFYIRRFEGVSVERASGVAQQMRHHDFDRPSQVMISTSFLIIIRIDCV
jgi:hypothetical protein